MLFFCIIGNLLDIFFCSLDFLLVPQVGPVPAPGPLGGGVFCQQTFSSQPKYSNLRAGPGGLLKNAPMASYAIARLNSLLNVTIMGMLEQNDCCISKSTSQAVWCVVACLALLGPARTAVAAPCCGTLRKMPVLERHSLSSKTSPLVQDTPSLTSPPVSTAIFWNIGKSWTKRGRYVEKTHPPNPKPQWRCQQPPKRCRTSLAVFRPCPLLLPV